MWARPGLVLVLLAGPPGWSWGLAGSRQHAVPSVVLALRAFILSLQQAPITGAGAPSPAPAPLRGGEHPHPQAEISTGLCKPSVTIDLSPDGIYDSKPFLDSGSYFRFQEGNGKVSEIKALLRRLSQAEP